MREILFRGKRVDNGEWVCGDLVRHYENQRVFILTEQLAYTTTVYGISRIVSERYFEVIPETIGQYTGIADTNGNKIFEGDVAVCQGGEYYHGTWEYESTEIVKDIRSMGFLEYCEKAIVIGNIHDKEEDDEL